MSDEERTLPPARMTLSLDGIADRPGVRLSVVVSPTDPGFELAGSICLLSSHGLSPDAEVGVIADTLEQVAATCRDLARRKPQEVVN